MLNFPYVDPETGGMNLKNTLCTIPPSLGGDFMESLSLLY